MLTPQWVSAENSSDESSSHDSSLLDAYSGAVIGALERVAPAVTFIEVEHAAGPAASGKSGPSNCPRATRDENRSNEVVIHCKERRVLPGPKARVSVPNIR